MNTEITDKGIDWVLYDGDCALCLGWVKRFERTLTHHGFRLGTLQSRGFDLTEMRVIIRDRVFGGADAVVQIARRIWWAWPLFAFGKIPGAMPMFRAIYRWIAANRHCARGACAIPARFHATDWLPLILFPAIAFMFYTALPAWVFMWTLAFALYAGCKWLTFSLARRKLGKVNPLRSLGYLFGWPGMDAINFLSTSLNVRRPALRDWLFAIAKIVLGIALIWFVAPIAAARPMLLGWIGMLGIILVLHFGVFHLLALAWQFAGINVVPLMRSPLLAGSLAEFWGKRWNTAYHELVRRFLFRPLLGIANAPIATLGVFLISGLVHDLVISVPARGGYGLPTAYFLLQGIGLVIERSRVGEKAWLGHGVRGWSFTLLIAGAPAFWLFHPPFIRNVILPMLHALGAT